MTPLQQQLIRIGSFAGPSWASYPLEEARGSDERLRLLREGEWVLYQDGTELCPVYLNRCRIGTIAQMLRYRRRVLRWYGARDLLAKESEHKLSSSSRAFDRLERLWRCEGLPGASKDWDSSDVKELRQQMKGVREGFRNIPKTVRAQLLRAQKLEQELNQCSPSSGRVRTENNTPAVAGKGCL